MPSATPTVSPPAFASVAALPEVTASVLKNKFSEVARLASRKPLAVSRHNRREFVILAAEHYEELQRSRRAPLENLTAEFDELINRMNTPKGKRAAASLFSASPALLGKAAVNSKPQAGMPASPSPLSSLPGKARRAAARA